MITRFISTIFGTANERKIRALRAIVSRINEFEPTISNYTNEQLAAKTQEFKEQVARGKHLDDILPEAFAVVREAAKRTLGQRHYDVQLMGGIALHQGNIAEMKTGEGKTLTATLALYLNALTGKGAHLVTVNDYLAKRDAEWMRPIYEILGLSVACIQHSMRDSDRVAAYKADILYVTNNELGFDYLRDNMKFRLEDYVQRSLHFAIVDEVDSILIDEARTPLIISGATEQSSSLYVNADQAVRRLSAKDDYEVDEKARTVLLTDSGVDKLEALFRIENLYDVAHMKLLHHINQALRAHALFRRDVDYVVTDDGVHIVDEFTGRILAGRRYSDGLHQALEAKEGVEIENESQTLASITLQNFFRMYEKLSGMTGTAMTEAEEFYSIYKLDVVSIPTNKPMIREDKPDLIFLTKKAKYKAIVEDIGQRHQKGQPVLIGTIAIETSELLSAILSSHGIRHEVLNAKQHQREAEIIELAGQAGRVTIATNMAGRGTDIKLSEESRAAGGLYILGTERHESRRIDNQLRGRSGRQGDPGESRFYLSLEDDLIRIFGKDTLKKQMLWLGMKEDEIIESRFVSKAIENAQERVEKHNFEIRKHLLEYDDVLNQQRVVIYIYRRDALEGENRIYELIRDMIINVIQDTLFSITQGSRAISKTQLLELYKIVSHLTSLPIEDFEKSSLDLNNVDMLERGLINILLIKHEEFRKQAPDMAKQAEKWLLLETIDEAWKQHMLNLDHLKEGIGLRGWGQKNPLIEYKREAFDMFKEMMDHIRRVVVGSVFHINVEHINARAIEARREKELADINMRSGHDLSVSSLTQQSETPTQSTIIPREVEPKVGRNDMCPCGSGKKFKKCCGQ
ncbi:MAG TPA: preprotein translocase subunit SecA [Candidatus Babeliales bacterium]|jgi:preprotein translocase subunit SecA|nr:preprotein translocase subunit SecA [Candidatus Babeliales bacterium]